MSWGGGGGGGGVCKQGLDMGLGGHVSKVWAWARRGI